MADKVTITPSKHPARDGVDPPLTTAFEDIHSNMWWDVEKMVEVSDFDG
jgi:hypothetical protein